MTSTKINVKEEDVPTKESPLNKVNMRECQMHENMILRHYENITHLKISGNNIKSLDLRALTKLEVLQCKRNFLNELRLHGESLQSLTASYNDLLEICISPAPKGLIYLDISCNKFSTLPMWLDQCLKLRKLICNNNALEILPTQLFTIERPSFQTLQLANNKLTSIPKFPNSEYPLQELLVQCNKLKHLPDNTFTSCRNLSVLNVSCNEIEVLPNSDKKFSCLEKLLATRNNLDDSCMNILQHFNNLKVLHAAYNNLKYLPGKCIDNWPNLEELILSGNKLKLLPKNMSFLKNLRVLRLHSNQLHHIPDLSVINTLRVIDLAHNELGKVDLATFLPSNVQFLDLSCNRLLQVDSEQLSHFRAQRKVCFVDVSGRNRFSLPTTAAMDFKHNSYTPWKIGFTETCGSRQRLYVNQLRMSNFCCSDGLFGIFDGENSSTPQNLLVKTIPTILIQNRSEKEQGAEYLKQALISTFKMHKQLGSKCKECAVVCHLTKDHDGQENPLKTVSSKKYILRAVTIGEAKAYLIRKQSTLPLSSNLYNIESENDGNSFPQVITPDIFEVPLTNDDEYLIIGNKGIWEAVQVDTIVREIRNEDNVILAAKRIQDIVQSFGVEGNISVIIVRFENMQAYVDRLINELRQNVNKKLGMYHNPTGNRNATATQFIGDDHASPVGQGISGLRPGITQSGSDSYNLRSFDEDSLSRGFHTADDDSDQNLYETDSILSEEQFKCWEYMLEQNTQLLFDKELNEISNSFTSPRTSTTNKALSDNAIKYNLMQSTNDDKVCTNYSQSNGREANKQMTYPKKSFLAKHSGSAKSFQKFSSIRTTSVSSSDHLYSATTNAANVGYFGTVHQIENDFNITQEQQSEDESVEYRSRMRHYWGVTSTEL